MLHSLKSSIIIKFETACLPSVPTRRCTLFDYETTNTVFFFNWLHNLYAQSTCACTFYVVWVWLGTEWCPSSLVSIAESGQAVYNYTWVPISSLRPFFSGSPNSINSCACWAQPADSQTTHPKLSSQQRPALSGFTVTMCNPALSFWPLAAGSVGGHMSQRTNSWSLMSSPTLRSGAKVNKWMTNQVWVSQPLRWIMRCCFIVAEWTIVSTGVSLLSQAFKSVSGFFKFQSGIKAWPTFEAFLGLKLNKYYLFHTFSTSPLCSGSGKGYHLWVQVLPVIHDVWDFTLSAVLHRMTVVVATATGDGQTMNDYVMILFRSAVVIHMNLWTSLIKRRHSHYTACFSVNGHEMLGVNEPICPAHVGFTCAISQ